ncbi:MAG: hypothetical protein ACYS74_23150, partial [Planctomycetota bacterium]
MAVMTSGCAVSQSSKLDEPRATMVQDEPEPILDGLDENQDEDFDLLEEDFEFLEAELDEQVVKVADPLEPLNRMMFNIND